MSDLDALLAGIVADPANAVRWLVMADWLEDHGFPERAELVRVHRELLRTCTDPDAHPDRPQLHARMMELMRAGVQPCLPQKTLTLSSKVELRMSFIPPGSFLMGSPETEVGREPAERLQYISLAHGFWLSATPVTQSQWAALSRDHTLREYELEAANSPCTCDWVAAIHFCGGLKRGIGKQVRLPTEAEWEYACRAGTTSPFYWGEKFTGVEANCDRESRSAGYLTGETPVGQYAAAAPHPWGLVDMLGNVFEWCGDSRKRYSLLGDFAYAIGLKSRNDWVLRGGNALILALDCRSASRCDRDTDHMSTCFGTGFRIACDLE